MPLVRVESIPNALTASRVALTAVAYAVAWAEWEALFAVLVLTIVLTDILDGPIARRAGVANREGANLDSLADFLFYASLPVWVWRFEPTFILRMLWLIGPMFALYVVANAVNRVRRGAIGYHNRITRTAGTVGVVYAMWVILFGPDSILFFVIVGVLAVDLVLRFVGAFSASPRRVASTAKAPREE